MGRVPLLGNEASYPKYYPEPAGGYGSMLGLANARVSDDGLTTHRSAPPGAGGFPWYALPGLRYAPSGAILASSLRDVSGLKRDSGAAETTECLHAVALPTAGEGMAAWDYAGSLISRR